MLFKRYVKKYPFVFFSFCTWNTVTIAQSNESKFFLSHSTSEVPSIVSQNLQPNRFIPRILQHNETCNVFPYSDIYVYIHTYACMRAQTDTHILVEFKSCASYLLCDRLTTTIIIDQSIWHCSHSHIYFTYDAKLKIKLIFN